MKILILSFFLSITFLTAQRLEILEIKQLKLGAKQNYRSLKISPDGNFLAFEMIKDKNYIQYIYDLKKDVYTKLGVSKKKSESQWGFTSSLYGNAVTYQLSWFWNRRKDRIYFDLIHSPRPGYFQLYRGNIRGARDDILKFRNQDIAKSNLFERYAKLQQYTQILYPSMSNHIFTNSKAPLVVLTADKKLAVFNHAPNDKPYVLTNPDIRAADLIGKFSPSDKEILFIRDYNEKSDIWLLTNKGGYSWQPEKKIVQSSFSDVSPEWCVDNKQFAFYSDQGHPKQFGIFIQKLESSASTEVVENVVRNHSRQIGPSWLSDKGFIYVKMDITRKNPLMFYNIATKKEKLISTNTASNEDVTVRQISPEEYLVAFTARGDLGSKDNLIWTKIYLMKIALR